MVIQIKDLVKKFGDKTAIDIPELSISKGEIIGLVGNNGAGKTTLFRLILDLLKAENGYVLSKGVDVSRSEDWKSYTGAFIDNRFLIEYLTPEEFLYFVGVTFGLKRPDVDERLREFNILMNGEILEQKKYIRNFSAGNKQKIGIIAAMMVRPEILILDEPFNFLDPSSQMEIKDLILKENRERGTTILISSHNLNYTTDISTRMILLESGIIIKDINNSESTAMEELTEYFVNKTTSL